MIALLLLACGDDAPKDSGWPPPAEETGTPPDPGPEGHDYASYTGSARFQSAWDADPDARACDLVWETSGTPRELCPDCLWTFDLAFTWDEAASAPAEGCFEDPARTDWTWAVGLSLDWYEFGVPVLWYYQEAYAYWYPLFVASWDYPTVRWGGGQVEYAYLEYGEPYYYTNYWYGSAEVR